MSCIVTLVGGQQYRIKGDLEHFWAHISPHTYFKDLTEVHTTTGKVVINMAHVVSVQEDETYERTFGRKS